MEQARVYVQLVGHLRWFHGWFEAFQDGGSSFQTCCLLYDTHTPDAPMGLDTARYRGRNGTAMGWESIDVSRGRMGRSRSLVWTDGSFFHCSFPSGWDGMGRGWIGTDLHRLSWFSSCFTAGCIRGRTCISPYTRSRCFSSISSFSVGFHMSCLFDVSRIHPWDGVT